MNNAKAFQAAQRAYDNALPEEERDTDRMCRVCAEWVAAQDFDSIRSHVCKACDAWAAGLEAKP